MRRYYTITTVVLIGAVALALGQAKKPAAKAVSGTSAALPPRATVESFLKHMFGWDPGVSWTITAIKPSPDPGISEIDLAVKTPQKSGQEQIFVLPGNKEAILGQMAPFPGNGGTGRPSDAAINAFLKQMIGSNPGITWTIAGVKPNAVANLTEVAVAVTTAQGRGGVAFLVTPDQKYAIRGDMAPFAVDPFAADRAKLQKGINGPARGPANAPLMIVEFADLQGPACKAANPEIQRLVADEPNARFVFQQYPLTQIHKWAFKAAEFGDCVYRENPAAFWKFVDQVYGAQEKITEATAGNETEVEKKAIPKLTELAGAAGVDGKKAAACASQSATAEHVNRSVALGKELGITGTPTLFVGGRRIGNLGQMPYDQLKKLADYMAKSK